MKMRCSCNAVMWLNDDAYRYDILTPDAAERLPATVETGIFLEEMVRAHRCQECGRLYVFWKGINSQPEEFIPLRDSKDANDG